MAKAEPSAATTASLPAYDRLIATRAEVDRAPWFAASVPDVGAVRPKPTKRTSG